MLQDVAFQPSRGADVAGKLAMLEPPVPFGNLQRRGAGGAAQRVARVEVTTKVGTREEYLDPHTHLLGQPPGGELPEILERCHAAGRCNRLAVVFFAKSGGILEMLRANIAIVSIFSHRLHGSYCFLNSVRNATPSNFSMVRS
jgi:hypothetical protein